jgi:hypothetical protein
MFHAVQTLPQFVNVVCMRVVDLLDSAPDLYPLEVHWVDVGTVLWPNIQGIDGINAGVAFSRSRTDRVA